MEEMSSTDERGREVARQGRSGGTGASAGRASVGMTSEVQRRASRDDGTGISSSVDVPDEHRGPVIVNGERVRALSERLDGLIEELKGKVIELSAASGLVMAVLMIMFGLSGGGAGYFWLAVPAFLAGMGIPWAAWRWRLRKLPPPTSEAPPSLDAEMGTLRERFDAFIPSPSELSSTMMKFVAGITVVVGALSIVVGVGLWSVGEVSFAIGTMVGGVGFSLTSLPMDRFGKHYDRVGALGKEIAAVSRERDRSIGSGGSVALGERLALQNELDELRSERKKWLQAAVAAGGASVAYPFLMGDVEAPGDLVSHVVFAVVFLVVLLISAVRKQSRVRGLEDRLEELDAGGGSAGRAGPEGGRVASPVAAAASEKGGAKS